MSDEDGSSDPFATLIRTGPIYEVGRARGSLRQAKNAATGLHNKLAEVRYRGYESLGDLPPELLSGVNHHVSALMAELVAILPPAVPESVADKVHDNIARRPLWRDRDRSLGETSRAFFFRTYPDWKEISLTWPILLKHDKDLYHALKTQEHRNEADRIPLPTKTKTVLSKLARICLSDHSMSISDLHSAVRAASRLHRKRPRKSPSEPVM